MVFAHNAKTRLRYACPKTGLTASRRCQRVATDKAFRTVCRVMKQSMSSACTGLVVLGGALSLSSPALADQIGVESHGAPIPGAVRERLAALLPDERAPRSRFEARRQARRAADIALNVLNSEGYFAADARIGVEMGPPIRARVSIDPGARFKIGEVNVHFVRAGESKTTTYASPEDLQIASGNFALASNIISAETALAADLRDNGYPDAEILARQLIGDRDAASVDVNYRLRPGAMVCVAGVDIQTDGRTREDIIARLSPVEPGDLYTASDMNLFARRLAETRMFTLADVNIADAPETPSDTAEGCQLRDILVQLEDAPKRTLALGGSYSTSEGIGLQADWIQRNLTGRLDTLRASLLTAELESGLSVDWEQPVFRGYGRKLTLGFDAIDETTDAYDRRAFGFSAGYDYRWTERLTLLTGLGFEVSNEDDGETPRDIQIVTGVVGAHWDGSNSELDPTQGERLIASVEPSYTLGDANGPFVRSSIEGRLYYPLVDSRFIIATRGRLGTVFGANNRDIPIDRRFYAGGGGSVRGYAYQALGPRDEDNHPIGGRSLVEGSIEGRWRLGNSLGLTAFVDTGEVTSAEHPKFADFRFGAGLGVRYFTQFGPLRLDLATPIDPRDGDDPVQIYISIGQAF